MQFIKDALYECIEYSVIDISRWNVCNPAMIFVLYLWPSQPILMLFSTILVFDHLSVLLFFSLCLVCLHFPSKQFSKKHHVVLTALLSIYILIFYTCTVFQISFAVNGETFFVYLNIIHLNNYAFYCKCHSFFSRRRSRAALKKLRKLFNTVRFVTKLKPWWEDSSFAMVLPLLSQGDPIWPELFPRSVYTQFYTDSLHILLLFGNWRVINLVVNSTGNFNTVYTIVAAQCCRKML